MSIKRRGSSHKHEEIGAELASGSKNKEAGQLEVAYKMTGKQNPCDLCLGRGRLTSRLQTEVARYLQTSKSVPVDFNCSKGRVCQWRV